MINSSNGDEQDLESLIRDLINSNDDNKKFTFAVNNVFSVCEALNICTHCVATEVLKQIKRMEEETCH